jgi:phenylalanyl-tRNA synthetase beta chain
MISSAAWLQAFVPTTLTPTELGELVSRHVATLDGATALRGNLAPFVIAQVVASEKIPDTRLSFNKVDDGSGELLEVVCGAPNVVVGNKYPFARSGTTMPAGLVIEKRKIRGFTSNGMLCSARELGLGEEHDGILALDTDAAPGTPFLQVMPVADTQLEFDVLANRPDLFSHLGLAREISALTGVTLREPAELGAPLALAPAVTGANAAASGGLSVRIDDLEGCPRYAAIVVRGVKVGPSPEWLVRRLEAIGSRSISNVVDATNYVLHGFGQPVHAFDLAKLAGSSIIVRRAKAGEKITTLDGTERSLTAEMTVIADAERAQAVAGVMGGHDSEVTEATTDVVLEIAVFDPKRTRMTRKALGLSTDASYRYERGVDGAATLVMAERLARLVVLIAGGKVDGAPMLVGGAAAPRAAVSLTHARVERVMGAPVPVDEIPRWLTAIGFDVEATGAGAWNVTPPSWRHDVSRDVDLIEEIARLRGFDALPDTLRPGRPGTVPDHPLHVSGERVRTALVAAGLYEVKPLPFVKGDDATHVRVQNPLADDEPHLRRAVLESLARRAEYNLSRMQGDVRLFEVGSVFAPMPDRAPIETVTAALLVMGARRPAHFTDAKPPAFDAWDAKALGEALARAASPGSAISLVAAAPESDALWTIEIGGVSRGAITRVTLDAPVWASPAFGVELTLGEMPSTFVAPPHQHAHGTQPAPVRPPHVKYVPLPTQPAAEIDLALLAPDAVQAGAIAAVVREAAGDILESLSVFDEFRGNGVPEGHRSLAWRLTFRHPERTLREKEIEGRRAAIVKALETQLGVRPRTA